MKKNYEFKDFTTENISWLIKDKIKSKIKGSNYLDCDLEDENFSSYWLFEVVIDNTLYVVKSGYTHQEKPDGTYCEGIYIESKPTNFKKLPTSAEQACIDMNQTFNPDEDGYYLEDIKLENLTKISSCGCTCGFAFFEDGEKLTLAIEVGSLDDIGEILQKNKIKYHIQHYDDGFNPSDIDLGNDWEIIIN